MMLMVVRLSGLVAARAVAVMMVVMVMVVEVNMMVFACRCIFKEL